MNLAALLLFALKTIPAVVVVLYRTFKVFWSAFAVGLAALAAAVNGNYAESLTILAAALGLGQVIHATTKATVAAELAQLGSGAAKVAAEVAKTTAEAAANAVRDLVHKIAPSVVFDGPPAVAFERTSRSPVTGPSHVVIAHDFKAAPSTNTLPERQY